MSVGFGPLYGFREIPLSVFLSIPSWKISTPLVPKPAFSRSEERSSKKVDIVKLDNPLYPFYKIGFGLGNCTFKELGTGRAFVMKL